jgi:probable rRNA maturation factor
MSDQATILLQVQADLAPPNSLPRERLEAAAQTVLAMHEVAANAMVSLIIGTDEQLRDMNLRYRDVDSVTDILSFPSQPLPQGVDEDAGYLGDIIIALPYVMSRAKREGHDLHDELILLLVHGVLHLLGYDHDTAENQTEMWKIQAEALAKLDVKLDVPDYIHE